MAEEVIRRQGSAAEHASFTGADGEWTHDTDLETVRAHDGATAGGFILLRSGRVQSISTNKTLALVDFGRLYDVDTSGGTRTVTLPSAAAPVDGWQVAVRKAAAGNTLTIATEGAETIDGAGTKSLSKNGQAILLRANGTNWVSIEIPGSAVFRTIGSSTDNALPRFDGAGGDTLQGSGIVVDDNNNISGYGQKIASKTSNFTLAAVDKGKTLECSHATALTVTVPPNSGVPLAVGYSVTLVQVGAGTVTVAEGTGVTVRSKDSKKSLDGQWTAATLYKRGTDEWVLVGNLA